MVIKVDSAMGSLSEEREAPSKRQLFLTVAGMIAVINSVVIGTTCGLFAGIVSTNPMIASPIAGLTGAGTSLVVHFAHQLRVLRRRDGMVVDEFAIAVPSHIVDNERRHGTRL
jgi:predicted RND superfamily exporter protein